MAEQLETNRKEKLMRAHVLSSKLTFDANQYEFDESFKTASPSNPWETHSTVELVACLERNPEIVLDAKVAGVVGDKVVIKELDRKSFIEAAVSDKQHSFRESVDAFNTDYDDLGTSTGTVGHEFMPFLGGPFYKNQQFYADYLRAHSLAFYSMTHDPIARLVINITRDFTLGRGFRVDSDNPAALALWRAFEDANELQSMMWELATELSCYGETMLWWLPENQTKITYNLKDNEIPHGIIPRVRLVDPSNIPEIITYPEDITRKLAYVWLAPTQTQIYSGGEGGKGDRLAQPTMKFIYRQIPADQMMHYKINSVSNEKRGRSDLFPVFGYLKRLRDAVNYSLISAQKQSAWGIDTVVTGSQADVDAYAEAQASMGTIAPAGSEFIHTDKIKREFLSNAAGKAGGQDVFDWCLSMIAAGVQIPISYFGTHHSGAQTRAAAFVGTEPVAKKFEMRQLVYERIIQGLWTKLMGVAGIKADCEVTFPEVITQDRSAKLKDLALAQTQRWLSVKRVAEIAAKELGVTEYDYEKEMAKEPGAQAGQAPLQADPLTTGPQAVPGSSEEKKKVKMNYGF